MVRTNPMSVQQAEPLVEEAGRLAAESNQALASMVSSMDAISESSQRVSKIIRAIDEITFHINILALNATVEAARAGEAGHGGAGVADDLHPTVGPGPCPARREAGMRACLSPGAGSDS